MGQFAFLVRVFTCEGIQLGSHRDQSQHPVWPLRRLRGQPHQEGQKRRPRRQQASRFHQEEAASGE